MTALQYTITAYVIVGALLWGYAAHLFLTAHALKRRARHTGGRP